MPARIRCIALAGLCWGIALALRAIGLTSPWGADNLGTAGAFFAITARNYLRYGYIATQLLPVVTAEGPPSPAVYYTHHPPLVPLLVSASFAVFGEHEWAARLVPLGCSIASLALLVHLARRFYGERVALLTLAIAATLPIEAHLASHVDVQGSVLLAVVLATVTSLAHGRHRLAVAGFTVAAAVDWPAFYLPILLAVAPWPFETRRPIRFVAGLLVYSALLFVALASWLSGPGEILELLGGRTLSFRSDQGVRFDFREGLRMIVGTYLWTLCTPPVLIAVLLWCLWRVPALIRRPDAERLALFLLLFGLTHLVVGFQGAYQHEFWTTYLRPGVPLVSALALDRASAAVVQGRGRALLLAAGLAAFMVPAVVTTLRLATHPLSARMLDADYTPHELGLAIRSCTPSGAAAVTSDYYGESATFFYAERPLAIGIVTVEQLDRILLAPRYDPPGGSGEPYEVPRVTPACFVLPRIHVRYFAPLAAHLRARYARRVDGPFETFAIGAGAAGEGPEPSALPQFHPGKRSSTGIDSPGNGLGRRFDRSRPIEEHPVIADREPCDIEHLFAPLAVRLHVLSVEETRIPWSGPQQIGAGLKTCTRALQRSDVAVGGIRRHPLRLVGGGPVVVPVAGAQEPVALLDKYREAIFSWNPLVEQGAAQKRVGVADTEQL